MVWSGTIFLLYIPKLNYTRGGIRTHAIEMTGA